MHINEETYFLQYSTQNDSQGLFGETYFNAYFVLIKLSNRAIRGISILDIYTFNDKDNFGLF